MTKTLKVALLIVQWMIVPVALLAVGFYLIGPRIGSTVLGKTLPNQSVMVQSPDSGNPTDITDPSKSSLPSVVRHGEPEISVTVQKGASFRMRHSSPSTRKKHHKKKPKVTVEPAAPEIPPPTTTTVLP